jgi:hypothetical protein
MLENVRTHPAARATAIDLFDGPYKGNYDTNIKLSGSGDRVTTIKGYSQAVLRGLPLEAFDIIYVDGSHAKADVLKAAVLSWRLLKPGGLLIFDDYHMARYAVDYSTGQERKDEFWCPKMAIDPFVQCFQCYCQVIHNSEQVILRKTRQDLPFWLQYVQLAPCFLPP